jgi:hypothetical protein
VQRAPVVKTKNKVFNKSNTHVEGADLGYYASLWTDWGPSKDHSTKVWSKLALWFPRRRLKCEMLTTNDNDIRWTTNET